MELEYKAQRRAPEQGERGVVQRRGLLAFNPVTAGGGALQQADDVEQRAFARA